VGSTASTRCAFFAPGDRARAPVLVLRGEYSDVPRQL
jgi:hypothetical protein